MPWPLSQDYNEALQNPQTSFSDPELRQGQAVVNALGIPQPCSGNFADVYAVECPATKAKWAVKCFTRQVHGLRERYSEISSFLQQVRLPFTVDFQYLEQGVRIGRRWYPILKMHWVEGLTLNAFVRDMVDRPSMLEKLSRVWVRMARRLREAGLAHCDLQHGNVLLVPDSEASALAVKLIDYDGMWVPALARVPSGEVGHPAYQHPQRRRERIYNPEVDRFPLLAIHVALRALIACGRPLWERYDTGDNLLFRQADFEAPTKSPLFAELLRLNHPELRALTVQLIDAMRMPLEQTPHLADLVPEEKSATPTTLRNPSPPAPRSRVTKVATKEPNPFQDLEPEHETPKRTGSLLPWMAAGSVAAFAVIGGILLWGTPHGSGSANPATHSAIIQSQYESTPQAPEEKKSPTRVDKGNQSPLPIKSASDSEKRVVLPPEPPKPSDPPPSPPKPKPEDKPEPPPPGGKLPMPDESDLKSANEYIHDTYKADYASKEPAELAALTEKLLKRGRKDFETSGRRFAFLREASIVAAKSGNVDLGIRTVDELGKLFAVEELTLKTAVLQEAAKNIRAIDTSKAILETSRTLLSESIRTDDYEDADRLVKVAEVAAFKAGVPRSALRDAAIEVQRLKTKYAAIKPALAKLDREPNDAEANRLVGSFRCFEKGEWESGLPLLVRSDDAKLKALAEKDLAAPMPVEACIELGDGWRQLSKAASGTRKEKLLLLRACHWYTRAVPQATEPTQSRLLAIIRPYYQSHEALVWRHLDVSQAMRNVGVLELSKGNKGISTRESWSGPVEITAVARTANNNIRFRAGRGACVIFNWENKRDELRITRPDGTNRPESGSLTTAPLKPLQPNTWYLLGWRITENGMTVSINGRTIFSEEHKNDLSEKHPISINSVDSDIEVLSFTVRPLGKKPG